MDGCSSKGEKNHIYAKQDKNHYKKCYESKRQRRLGLDKQCQIQKLSSIQNPILL